MQLLKAVNSILPKLGEHPVTSLEDRSPTLAVILPEIDAVRRELLTKGWWFNTSDQVTLYPNSDGDIEVPTDLLSFIPAHSYISAVARGERFYNIRDLTYTYPSAIKGRVVLDVPYEELPESVAHYVLYSALVTIYATDIGLENTLQLWTQRAAQAESDFEQEHLRNKRFSLRKSRRAWNMYRAVSGNL